MSVLVSEGGLFAARGAAGDRSGGAEVAPHEREVLDVDYVAADGADLGDTEYFQLTRATDGSAWPCAAFKVAITDRLNSDSARRVTVSRTTIGGVTISEQLEAPAGGTAEMAMRGLRTDAGHGNSRVKTIQVTGAAATVASVEALACFKEPA